MSPKNGNKAKKPSNNPSHHNDQLGENASEVLRSEDYSNAERSGKKRGK